jgi:hypothetical protein
MKHGSKAVSTVVAALVVTTAFLAVVSMSYAGIFRLSDESSSLVRRESERAMEAFFRIYWIDNTRVVLFNNHSSVAVTLRYWVSTDPATGLYDSYLLDPATYSVPPGGMKVVTNFKAKDLLKPLNRVVSERGTPFEVGDQPPQPPSQYDLFKLVEDRKLVRPGFSSASHGPLGRIILSTGPGFSGGAVTLTCVDVQPAPASCAAWSISFSPASPVSVPAGGSVVVNILASIPTTTPTGTYFVRVKADAVSVSSELVLAVSVGDFTVAVNPTSVTILRRCAATLTLSISPTNYDGRVSFRISSVFPSDDRLNFMISPNPVETTHGLSSSLVIFVNNQPPAGAQTRTVTVEAFDGVGPSRTTSLTVTISGTAC